MSCHGRVFSCFFFGLVIFLAAACGREKTQAFSNNATGTGNVASGGAAAAGYGQGGPESL